TCSITQHMTCLSATIAGQRTLKTCDNQYVRAWRGPSGEGCWYVDKAPHCDECEHWYIEQHNWKVASYWLAETKYLRARRFGGVDLVDSVGAWAVVDVMAA
ncbi:hypothetical protein PMAYCL1PPCAC_21441, partial [Pristionchus mayeri]